MLYLIVYLFDVYGPILRVILGLSIFFFIGAIACIMSTVPDAEDEKTKAKNDELFTRAGKALRRGLIALVIYILLPSKQGLAMLGGVYVGTEIYEGLNKSTLVEKSVKILNRELDNYLDQYLISKEPANSAKAETAPKSN